MNEIHDTAILDQVEATIERFTRVRTEIGRAIFGQERVIEESLITLLAGGHVLLVGVPGLAKTRLVETLGRGARADPEARAVHARPDAGRHPGLRGARGEPRAGAAASASSRARCSASC